MREIGKMLGGIGSALAGLLRRTSVKSAQSTNTKIKHVVVLVLENRSFDHMLGNLRSPSCKIDGLYGVEFNHVDPFSKTGMTRATQTANYVPDVDPSPSHEFHDVLLQLFAQFSVPNRIVDHNHGFMYDYAKVSHNVVHGPKVMQCFGENQLPALHTLAKEYAICDHWFSSLPGPTWPNRFFIHCATSGGFVDNTVRDYPMTTIFQNLSSAGVTWRVYYHDFPQTLALRHQRQYLWTNYEYFDAFIRDCAEGQLPQYSFLEPRYFNEGTNRANDQHPIHGVVLGDNLIADVYEALRSSPNWLDSLLLITWDEHGGFYDHVLPPPTVNPDGKNAPEFKFTRLGIRVPAVLVSPYIQRGQIDSTVYDHSSICATLKCLFNLPNFLNKRDAAANTFDRNIILNTPRTDTLDRLPRIIDESKIPQHDPSRVPATELHSSLVALAESFSSAGDIPGKPAYSESEAAARSKAGLEQFKATRP